MNGRRGRWSFADGEAWDLEARTRVLGILNVTPDSFSDGGRWESPAAAVARGLEMAAEGADGIDVGGESTRPGAEPVPVGLEMERVVPVIRALRARLDRVRISVDTSKAAVAEAALEAGADIVNDVTAFSGDPAMAPLVARTGAAAILMHMRGTPRTMQADTVYADLLGEIAAFLRLAIQRALGAGAREDGLVIDPGIGFGKSAAQNFEILGRLDALGSLGRPILIGASRKSFLGHATGHPPDARLEAGLAAAAAGVLRGASLVRVHDVGPTVRMMAVLDAIRLTRIRAG